MYNPKTVLKRLSIANILIVTSQEDAEGLLNSLDPIEDPQDVIDWIDDCDDCGYVLEVDYESLEEWLENN